MKTCTKCGKPKPLEAFGINRGQGGIPYRRGHCRACESQRVQAWYRKNAARQQARQKRLELQRVIDRMRGGRDHDLRQGSSGP